jgi:hypothetical protein
LHLIFPLLTPSLILKAHILFTSSIHENVSDYSLWLCHPNLPPYLPWLPRMMWQQTKTIPLLHYLGQPRLSKYWLSGVNVTRNWIKICQIKMQYYVMHHSIKGVMPLWIAPTSPPVARTIKVLDNNSHL